VKLTSITTLFPPFKVAAVAVYSPRLRRITVADPTPLRRMAENITQTALRRTSAAHG